MSYRVGVARYRKSDERENIDREDHRCMSEWCHATPFERYANRTDVEDVAGHRIRDPTGVSRASPD